MVLGAKDRICQLTLHKNTVLLYQQYMNLLLLSLSIGILVAGQDCFPGQFISDSGECLSCDRAPAQFCGNICLNRVWDGLSCIDCLIQPGVDVDAPASFGECVCLAGTYWMGPSFQCLSCSQIDDPSVCPIFCPGYFYSSILSVCMNCADSPNVDPNNGKNSQTMVSGCLCLSGYGWQNEQCLACAQTAQQACRSSTCSEFVWASTFCGDCTNLEHTNTVRTTPVGATCLCNNDYVWDSTATACVICTDAKTQENCLSQTCYNYAVWSNKLCVTCKGVANADTSVQQFPVYGQCSCLVEYFWNSATSTCTSCKNSPQNGCGVNNCINYFWAKGKCQSCFTLSNTVPKVALTTPDKLAACLCVRGYQWSNNTLNCVNCDPAQGLALVLTISSTSNTCVNCGALKNGQTGLKIGELSLNYSCVCASNYTFIKGACTCTLPFFDYGRSLGCVPCSKMPGGVGYLGNGTCTCIAGAAWNIKLNACQCILATQFLLAGRGCQLCISLGAALTQGVANASDPGQCICATGFIWDNMYNTCVCKAANEIWGNGTCSNCNLAIFYSNTTRNTPTSCFCRANMVWNVALRSCICVIDAFPLTKATCILCSGLPGSTGKGFASGCVCATGWQWNPTSLQCICLNNSCTCGLGYVLRGKNCNPCSNYTLSTGRNINNTFCECEQSYTWDNILGRCFCPSTAVSGINRCYACTLANNAVSKVSNVCTCSTNYVWQATQQRCVLSSTADTIILHNGTKVSCKGLGSSTGLSFDNFNCRCESNFIWRDFERKCWSCALIKYSNGTASSGISCFCQAGYGWDPIGSDCKSLDCKPKTNIGDCTSCSLLPGSAMYLMSVDYGGGMLLSGDNSILTLYANVSAAFTEKYLAFKCICSIGYGWSKARRRCFKTSINGTY